MSQFIPQLYEYWNTPRGDGLVVAHISHDGVVMLLDMSRRMKVEYKIGAFRRSTFRCVGSVGFQTARAGVDRLYFELTRPKPKRPSRATPKRHIKDERTLTVGDLRRFIKNLPDELALNVMSNVAQGRTRKETPIKALRADLPGRLNLLLSPF